jgi:predicted GNAT family acetyltransferase
VHFGRDECERLEQARAAKRARDGTFEILRKTGRKAVLKCPFMSRYFAKHPEYADIVVGRCH